MSKPTDLEKAEAVAAELRELLSEARGTLRDFRTEIRNARGLYDSLAREQLDTAIAEHTAKLRENYQKSMTEGAAMIIEQFQRIERIMVASGIAPDPGTPEEQIRMGTLTRPISENARRLRTERAPHQKGKRQ